MWWRLWVLWVCTVLCLQPLFHVWLNTLCMTMPRTSWLYSLSVLELRDELRARDLETGGNMDILRRRLRDFVSAQPDDGMLSHRLVSRLPTRHELVEVVDTRPASVASGETPGAAELMGTVQGGSVVGGGCPRQGVERGFAVQDKLQMTVVTDLIKSLPSVDGTNPVSLCDFLIEATGIMDLDLVPINTFVLLLVSRTVGNLSRDMIPLSRSAATWDEFCFSLMALTCPPLVREDLITSHITRRFQNLGECFDTFATRIFQAARVLSYRVPEITLVNLCLQNMLSHLKIHLAFHDKPATREQLTLLGVELTNAMFIQQVGEAQTMGPPVKSASPGNIIGQGGPGSHPNVQRRPAGNREIRCWSCNVIGHYKHQCPTKTRQGRTQPPPAGNGARAPI